LSVHAFKEDERFPSFITVMGKIRGGDSGAVIQLMEPQRTYNLRLYEGTTLADDWKVFFRALSEWALENRARIYVHIPTVELAEPLRQIEEETRLFVDLVIPGEISAQLSHQA
jgi:hypothetical protein